MSSKQPRRRFFVITLGALVACTSDPVTLCGCDPTPPAGRVYGVVRDPGGAPVPYARVLAQASGEACAAPYQYIGEGTADASGRFRFEVFQTFDPRPAGVCLGAWAAAPSQSTLAASDTVPFQVRFAQAAVRDSVRVDLVLRAP